MSRSLLWTASLAALLAATPALAETVAVPGSARTALALTIYGGGFGLIEEHRTAPMTNGTTALSFDDMSTGLMPSSVRVVPIGAPGALVEQVYDGEVVSTQSLLRAHVGREVTVVRRVGDGLERLRATVLRAEPQPVLSINGAIVTDIVGWLEFDSLPADVPLTPTLNAIFSGTKSGSAEVAVRYLSNGLSWSADHVIELADDEQSLSLTSLATVSNTTGRAWDDANLALIAGTINRPQDQAMLAKGGRGALAMAAAPMAMREMDSMPERAAVGGYHVYTVPRPVTLPDRQTKQIGLLSAEAVKAEVLLESYSLPDYIYRNRAEDLPATHPSRVLTFTNAEKTGPGVPLPEGAARVYVRDGQGMVRFLGQDNLAPTAVGQETRLTLGEAFDVSVKGRQTDYQRLSSTVYETAYEVVVSNGSDKAATVRVFANLPGDWTMVDESRKHDKRSASRVMWPVDVKAGDQTTLTYRVRVTD